MRVNNPFGIAFVATLGVGLGIVLLQSVGTLSTILLYVGTALFLSLGLDPVVSFLERRRLPRWAAVLLTIIALLGVFAGIVLMILPIIIDQVSQLITQVERLVTRQGWENDIKDWLQGVFPNLEVDQVWDAVNSWLLALDWGSITQGVLSAGVAVISGLAGAFIVLILTIYFTASTPSLKAAVYRLVPASKRHRFVDLAEQITDSVGYYVIGQVSLATVNGILSAIFLSIIGAPFPAVLACVAFFFSLIPLVGTLTGSTLIVLTCLIPGLGAPITALIAAIYYLVYMQIEAYVLAPRIMGRAVAVPGAVVVIAALAGGALLGLLGALIAPLTALGVIAVEWTLRRRVGIGTLLALATVWSPALVMGFYNFCLSLAFALLAFALWVRLDGRAWR
ncbi:MAG: AI-2E family transporter, partial [Microbacteriaceae bacterium]|nr:AI-2E family transporter [Microbacteriaceae bacterium]